MGFAIHWHESAMELHVFPILIPPPPPSPPDSVTVMTHKRNKIRNLEVKISIEVSSNLEKMRKLPHSAWIFFLIHVLILFTRNSVQFSHSVVSDSLWPHGLQHSRTPCPSPTAGVYSNSCPLSQWYHPTSSSSVFPFSSSLQSFPATGSFPMS